MIRTVIVCLLIVSGVQAKQLECRSVTAVKGSSAVLRCSCSNKELQLVLVEWEKFANRTKLGVYHVSSKNTTLNNKRIKLEVNGQHSTITIKDVLMSDKGWYDCIFHTFPYGKLKGRLFLDVKDKEMPSNQAAYIIPGVVIAVIAIGILILLLYFVHRKKKSGIHLPNRINVILQNASSTDNVDTARQPNKPPTPNSDSEDLTNDYFSVVLRSSV
ncbi:T-cell immunoreceptor with Ig and ITIM domains-like isoform X2 [Hemitrygon akajei]|uniref:T-cell immunoreceptor with Ig and ITIM domains-like isoform X2 n=1 Tax=Hemitrygon akajei TaxID=2704970 RepID=UPI003BF9D96C